MKTEVSMKRPFLGSEISQKSKSEFFSLTDLVKVGNKWRISNTMPQFDEKAYLKNKSTIEFMEELKSRFGEVKISARGRGHHTWVHPLLFIDIALAISPTLKIDVYSWLFDNLLKYRNESGDSYKRMSGALMINISNKSDIQKAVMFIAKRIQVECGVKDWNSCSENQLKLRDRIQENFSIINDYVKNYELAIELSCKKAREVIK